MVCAWAAKPVSEKAVRAVTARLRRIGRFLVSSLRAYAANVTVMQKCLAVRSVDRGREQATCSHPPLEGEGRRRRRRGGVTKHDTTPHQSPLSRFRHAVERCCFNVLVTPPRRAKSAPTLPL